MSDGASTTIKIGSFLSIGLGPLLSDVIPMASDLRPWAFWVSGVVSLAVFIGLTYLLSDKKAKQEARVVLVVCLIAAVVSALLHVFINLFWLVESGGFTDKLWQLGLIATFGFATGGLTGALVALEKVTKNG